MYFLDNDFCLVLYDYDVNVGKDKGLIHDYFVNNDFDNNYDDQIIHNILYFYNKSSKKAKKINQAPIDIFFKERVGERLNVWYQTNDDFCKNVIINGETNVSTSKIIEETKAFFEKQKVHMSFITQGDHNVLNISIAPCFFDVSSAGYNYAVGEFAMCFVSILFFDQYICPKYHKESYKNHEKIFERLDSYKPTVNYNVDEENIFIYCDFKISKIRKQYLLEFLNIVKNFDIYDDLIYFIIMRLLCIFNINTFEEDDYYYILFLMHLFYDKLRNINYNSLKSFILNMNVLNETETI